MTQRTLFDDTTDPDPPARRGANLAHAVAAGEAAAEACEAKAERLGWGSAAAGAFIVTWLREHGPTSGETLTDEASKLHAPHDARAYGAVFTRLKREGLIETCGFVRRAKGHGAPGLMWRLTAA